VAIGRKVRLRPLKRVVLAISKIGTDTHVAIATERRQGNEIHIGASDEPLAISNYSAYSSITMFEIGI
jgi:hypothetical protein